MKHRRELAAAYDRVWDAFQRGRTTADGRHDTPYWRSHADPYAVCVIRIDAGALQPGLDDLRADLDRLNCVRLHPDPFLHITLQELGFIVDTPTRKDEISTGRLEEFVQAAVEPIASVDPLTLTLGGANAFQDAVFLEVHGGERLPSLHARLFDLAAVPVVPAYPYLPHCTIAHFAGEHPVGPAIDAIAPWRETLFGTVTVNEVEIVTLDPGQAYPALESYAVIPLGSA